MFAGFAGIAIISPLSVIGIVAMFGFEILVVLFDRPALMGETDQRLHRRGLVRV